MHQALTAASNPPPTNTQDYQSTASPEQIEAAAWWELHFAAKERYKTGSEEEPFLHYASRLFEGMKEKAEILAPLYAQAEENREIILSRFTARVRAQIEKSSQIPAFCKLPYSVASVVARTPIVEKLHTAFLDGKNLYISGTVGTGKTYAACQCVYLWCRQHFRYGFATSIRDEAVKGVPPHPIIENFFEASPVKDYPLFLASRDFLHELRSTFNGNGNETEVLDKYTKAPVLVFDDLGAEKITDWTRDRVFFLLEKRLYDKAKQTIITSNLPIADLAATIDDRLASRIVERCEGGLFALEGADLRIKR